MKPLGVVPEGFSFGRGRLCLATLIAMAKPRVHEVAHDMGVDGKTALLVLRELGEFVKSPSSTIEPPVARKLRAALEGKGRAAAAFSALGTDASLEVERLLETLPSGLPSVARLLAGGTTDCERTMTAVVEGGMFLFLDAERGRTVGLRRGEQRLEIHDIPARTGLVAIERTRRLELVMWEVDERGLWCTDVSLLRSRPSGVWATEPESALEPLRGDDSFSAEARPIGLLQQLLDLAPRDVRDGGGGWSGERRYRGLPAATVMARFQRPSAELGSHTRSSSRPGQIRDDGVRWKVRGHWRRQWYPSSKEHRAIWIDEHTAGAAAGDLVERDRVYVI